MELNHTVTGSRSPEGHDAIRQLPRKPHPPIINDVESVRRNVRIHSEGIFQVPWHHRQHFATGGQRSALPEIPSRADVAHLSQCYLDSIHEMYPFIHWPTFQKEVDQLYTSRSFEDKSPAWIGLFFAVMACGTLHPTTAIAGPQRSFHGGTAFYRLATSTFSPWPEDLTVTHAKTLLLTSIFATEMGLKSAASMWLASAVRVAQTLELNEDLSALPTLDSEMRRRLWWSIYTWER